MNRRIFLTTCASAAAGSLCATSSATEVVFARSAEHSPLKLGVASYSFRKFGPEDLIQFQCDRRSGSRSNWCEQLQGRGATEWKGGDLEGPSTARLHGSDAGRGINDAPALVDLGIAMGTGTDLAMRPAAVVLMDSRLEKIEFVLQLSRKAMRIIRQNLFWAFFYNAVAIVLVITGVLNSILAAAAMLLSSASVIGNTMRLGRTRELAVNSGATNRAVSRSAFSSVG